MEKLSNKILNDKINSWVDSLTKRLIEIRFFHVEDIKTSLRVHFKQAMIECLKEQITQNEVRYNKLKLSLPYLYGQKKQKLQSELTLLKEKIKKENRLYSQLDRDKQAKELVLWMRANHEASLLEFYNHFDKTR